MYIQIRGKKTTYEFYEVPDRVGKAVVTLLNECANDESAIVSATMDSDYCKDKTEDR